MRTFLFSVAIAGSGFGLDRLATSYGQDDTLHVLYVLYVLAVSGIVGWLWHTREVAQAEADTDGLTGIPNRRAFLQRGRALLNGMRRTGTPLTVVYLDVERFKQVNDRLGHEAGDRLLRCVGRTLAGTLREGDAYARLGGDEFVVLLEGERPSPLISRLHQALRLAARAEGFDVGFSVGAVTFRSPPESAEAMVLRGDSAMYEAKTGGALVHQVA